MGGTRYVFHSGRVDFAVGSPPDQDLLPYGIALALFTLFSFGDSK